MESVDLHMEDLFDTDAVDDDDLGAIAPMPDLDDENAPMRQENDNEEQDGEANEEVLNRLKDLKGAAKKKVMRPQPKLDVDRLKTKRGLPQLRETFEKVKFKGPGHEFEDLQVMMGKLEHWGHRLFPKMPFDEFIERLERLGQKKQVQTCVRKIRMGMPMLDDEIVEQHDDHENNGNEPQDGDDNENQLLDQDVDDDIDAEEAFEEMLRKEREKQEHAMAATQPAQPVDAPSGSQCQTSASKDAKSVNDEQRERMERNKRLAMEKRAKRMGIKLDPPKEQLNDLSQVSVSQSSQASMSQSSSQAPMSQSSQRPPTSPESPDKQADTVQQTEDEIMKELDSDVEDMETIDSQPVKSTGDLKLHLTETETEQLEPTGNLKLHMTETDNMPSGADIVSPSSKVELKLTATASTAQEPNKSHRTHKQLESMCNGQNFASEILTEKPDDTGDLNLQLTNTEEKSEASLPTKYSASHSSGRLMRAEATEQSDDIHLKLTETPKLGKKITSSSEDKISIASEQAVTSHKKTLESESDELTLNLSTSDNEMTTDDS